MRKATLAVVLVLALLFSAAAGRRLVELGSANQYLVENVKEGEVPPPNRTKPSEIRVFSQTNNRDYSSRNLSLSLNVSVPQPENA